MRYSVKIEGFGRCIVDPDVVASSPDEATWLALDRHGVRVQVREHPAPGEAIGGTQLRRGRVERHAAGVVFDVQDAHGEWVMTVGGRDVSVADLDDLVRRWHAEDAIVSDALSATEPAARACNR